jgi:V/A-type H+-transporting ATPase subunit D
MARLNVNPNRMELTKLKARIATAKRGHKLLKDKQDELMRQFIDLVRLNNKLRKEVEAELMDAYKDFVLVGATISPEFLEESVMFPREEIGLDITLKNVMSVMVPKMRFTRKLEGDESSIYPYGFYTTSDELDRSLNKLVELLPKLLELGEIEKTCALMADEIEKTRRRVNALEYMTIPQLQETIRYIQMKLDENERGNLIRLMKFKSMMAEEAKKQEAKKAPKAM